MQPPVAVPLVIQRIEICLTFVTVITATIAADPGVTGAGRNLSTVSPFPLVITRIVLQGKPSTGFITVAAIVTVAPQSPIVSYKGEETVPHANSNPIVTGTVTGVHVFLFLQLLQLPQPQSSHKLPFLNLFPSLSFTMIFAASLKGPSKPFKHFTSFGDL